MPVKTKEIPTLSDAQKIRFWSKVDKSPGQGPNGDCWEWIGGKSRDGYGQFGIGDGKYQAHRVMYVLAINSISAGMHILHHCDNRGCICPEHLWSGTNAENARDCAAKGRSNKPKGDNHHARMYPECMAHGERVNTAKLTETQVREIREKYIPWKYTLKMLGKEYGVDPTAISYIIQRKTWKYVI